MSGGWNCEECDRKSPAGCLGVMQLWRGTGDLSRAQLLLCWCGSGGGSSPGPSGGCRKLLTDVQQVGLVCRVARLLWRGLRAPVLALP